MPLYFKAGIYVPIINEPHIKQIFIAEGKTKSWCLHRTDNDYIDSLLQFYQDQMEYDYRRVFRGLHFIIPHVQLEGFKDAIHSVTLGLFLSAFEYISKKKRRYNIICATGEIDIKDIESDNSEIFVKEILSPVEKFKIMCQTLNKSDFPENYKFAFICVVNGNKKIEIEAELEKIRNMELTPEIKDNVDIYIYPDRIKYEQLLYKIFYIKPEIINRILTIPGIQIKIIFLIIFFISSSLIYMFILLCKIIKILTGL